MSTLIKAMTLESGNNRMRPVLGYANGDGSDDTKASLAVTHGNPQYVPRLHLPCPTAPAINTPTQITATSTPFQRAWFYGYSAAPNNGAAPTTNVANVLAGEKDAAGKTYCVDVVPPNGGYPLPVEAAPGETLDLKDFWFITQNAGDSIFVKYQP